MDTSSGKQEGYRAEFFVLVGYILFFCLAAVFYIIFIFSLINNAQESQFPSQVNVFATSLPPLTPIPSIPLDYEPGLISIFSEEFADNQNSWTDGQTPSELEFKDGKLYLESSEEDTYALTSCSKCPFLTQPYFLTVELSTDRLTDEGFGVVFMMEYSRSNFYLFRINLESKQYVLSRYTAGTYWSRRITGSTDHIQSYPAVNQLGIYINRSIAEFYINGKLIDTYQDSGFSLQTGLIGIYVNDAGFNLVADNLVIDKIDGK